MKKRPDISVAPVTAFIGYPRSGKTYHMTMLALALLAAGEKVASRHEIRGALPLTSDLEMVHLAGYHVFLDEWHIDRPAKEWRHTPRVINHFCSQAAKYDLHIYWSAQDWFFMPYEIRAVTEYAWVHESMFRNKHTDRSRIGLHRAQRIAGCEIEAEHRNPPVVETKYFFIKKKIAQAYNSKRAIFVPEDVMSADDLQKVLNPTNRAPIGKIDHSPGGAFRDIYFVESEKRNSERRALSTPVAATDEAPNAESDTDEQ